MAGKRKTLSIPEIDVSAHSVDVDAIPEGTKVNLSRVICRQIREYFSKPGVQEEYEKWLVEYRRLHPQSKQVEM